MGPPGDLVVSVFRWLPFKPREKKRKKKRHRPKWSQEMFSIVKRNCPLETKNAKQMPKNETFSPKGTCEEPVEPEQVPHMTHGANCQCDSAAVPNVERCMGQALRSSPWRNMKAIPAMSTIQCVGAGCEMASTNCLADSRILRF